MRTRLLLAAATIAQDLFGVRLVRRFAIRIILVTVLAIVSGVLVSAFIVGAFYALYIILVANGVAGGTAMAITGTGMALVTLIFIGGTVLALRHLRQLPHMLLHKSAVTGATADTIEAFMHGLTAGSKG